MLTAAEIDEEMWRAAMSTYHKTIRKNPGMAWQEVCAEVINILVKRQQMEACRRARKIMQARGELPNE